MAPADALADVLRGVTTLGAGEAFRTAAVAQLTGIEIIVKRQGNIDAMIQAAVSQAKGAAILISLEGWDNVPATSGQALLDLRFSISIWTIPAMRAGAISESIALGALVKAIHGWVPDDSPFRKRYRWRVGSGESGQALTASKQLLNVYEFPANLEHPLFHNNQS